MPKVPTLKPGNVVKCFKKLGWEVARHRGSHIILTKPGHIATLSVPKHREVARGTLISLLRKAGVKEADFIVEKKNGVLGIIAVTFGAIATLGVLWPIINSAVGETELVQLLFLGFFILILWVGLSITIFRLTRYKPVVVTAIMGVIVIFVIFILLGFQIIKKRPLLNGPGDPLIEKIHFQPSIERKKGDVLFSTKPLVKIKWECADEKDNLKNYAFLFAYPDPNYQDSFYVEGSWASKGGSGGNPYWKREGLPKLLGIKNNRNGKNEEDEVRYVYSSEFSALTAIVVPDNDDHRPLAEKKNFYVAVKNDVNIDNKKEMEEQREYVRTSFKERLGSKDETKHRSFYISYKPNLDPSPDDDKLEDLWFESAPDHAKYSEEERALIIKPGLDDDARVKYKKLMEYPFGFRFILNYEKRNINGKNTKPSAIGFVLDIKDKPNFIQITIQSIRDREDWFKMEILEDENTKTHAWAGAKDPYNNEWPIPWNESSVSIYVYKNNEGKVEIIIYVEPIPGNLNSQIENVFIPPYIVESEVFNKKNGAKFGIFIEGSGAVSQIKNVHIFKFDPKSINEFESS